MNRLALIGLMPLVLAAPALAQPMDHSKMHGMSMPGTATTTPKMAPTKPARTRKPAPKPAAADPHAGHAKAPAVDPHAGHTMPAAADPHAGHTMPSAADPHAGHTAPVAPDPHAGHTMAPGAPPMDHAAMPEMVMPGSTDSQPLLSEIEVPKTPPPAPPADHAADRYSPPEAMAAARTQLRQEHGAMPVSKVMASLAEHQARKGADGYRWEGEAWFGGDINRLVLKTEGEGTSGEGVESAELQALYSRAVGVYTDVQVGMRQDFEPRGRTYATVGFETLLPYWFEVEGAAFLSTKGDLLGRLEGSYDLRLTNRWILQPRAELNFAAQDDRAAGTGSGLSNAELGLRLRYEIRREFAPYIGVSWERKVGRTADYARALGDTVEDKSVVFGVRSFF
ncbi:MAG: copper resistance protein B [Phenylobacterium sp.]|nr:copper resistance protein B [Phenylobacterium sp.]MBP7817119.1 copper resistance protein B [Phenylobacterium sp.]